jgi:cytoskeletal protein CcmA (bactofilin family)
MSSTASIGKTIHVKGTVTAQEPFRVDGIVDGTITVSGHALTISADGTLNADAVADTILVEGTAKGTLLAESRMTLKNTANVTGDIQAPILTVLDGATIKGKVAAGTRKKPAA